MEYLSGNLTLSIPAGCFPISTDSMILADFVRLRKNAAVLDLGSGCGTVGLLLCAGKNPGHITGVEIDPRAHAAALENISRNRLDDRMESICADLRKISDYLPRGGYSCCVSNPPYFSGGPESALPLARRNDFCSPEALFSAAQWALDFGGDFFLVHRPEYLAVLCACAERHGMAAKQLRMVRHRPQSPISLILLQFRVGAKPGLQCSEFCLYDADGTPTSAYRRIYHLQEA